MRMSIWSLSRLTAQAHHDFPELSMSTTTNSRQAMLFPFSRWREKIPVGRMRVD